MKLNQLIKRIIKREKYFSSKIMQKMMHGNQIHALFMLFKEAIHKLKVSGQHFLRILVDLDLQQRQIA